METGAIELIDGSEERRIAVSVERAIFVGTDAMGPMRAGAKVPVQMNEEKLEAFELREARRPEKNRAGNSGEAGVATHGKAQTIGVGESIPEISRETAIQKSIVASLAVGLEVGASERVIERAEKAGDLSATAAGGKPATFSEKIDFGNACCAAMAEQLNDTGDSIGAIESAFCAVDDFDLVNVIERLIRKIEEAAGFIEGRAVDEELREVGVATVEEKSGEAAFAAGAGEGRARKGLQRVCYRNELAPADFLLRDHVDGSRRLA